PIYTLSLHDALPIFCVILYTPDTSCPATPRGEQIPRANSDTNAQQTSEAMNFLEFMVKTPFRERAAAAARLSDGTGASRNGKKCRKLPKEKLTGVMESRGSFCGRTHTWSRASVIPGKSEGGRW